MFELSGTVAWTVLVIGGACEVIWAQALTARNRRLWFRIGQLLAGLALSLSGLGLALTTVEVTTGYAVWVGIGALATIGYSVLRGHERLTVLRTIFIVCLLGGAIGLKVVG